MVLGRVTSESREPRADHVLKLERLPADADLQGYAGVVTPDTPDPELLASWSQRGVPIIHGLPALDLLADGDVVSLAPGGQVRTLYRIGSSYNALLVTERCNSFCLMCSQPPRNLDESGRVWELLRLVDLIDPGTRELGITGGEPTLLKGDLLRLVRHCKERLPATALHILSNGRLFYYGSLARKLAAIEHPDLMIGVPLYSDLDSEHDFVVQASGAFDQTMIGLHNLGRFGVPVEIRVVIHAHTWRRLPALAEFIYRNLPFASHVALMGLEIMGFATANLEDLWVDPVQYREELGAATSYLARRGMRVSIYNHQLCVLPRYLWPYSRKSISDWKNDFLPECAGCEVQSACGGFFTSSLQRRYSRHIAPIGAPAA
jgi:His-Xaa-Ser system radical SAM maturase HxsC